MRTTRTTAAALVLTAATLVGTASAAEAITGTWKITTTFRNRSRNSILKLDSDRGQLTGVMLHHLGHHTPLEQIQFDAGKLRFEVTSTRGGRKFTTKYQGVVNQDGIEGTTEFNRRGSSQTIHWKATRTTDRELATHLDPPPVEADIDLTEDSYQVWRKHILPDDSELAWQEIPWLSTFKDGILAANTQQKPLLLWTMNGHPLGCT